ncbi:MAG: hypothetical protein KVP17_001146 [Porospora cf. gigantea B]|uniref:uncharacterized protein n=1 Tax=Porospora cf. gigantea B TaxID=2853592 RepID=UPI003571A362|nr:MAG: hypothetical protein KVP17_001146 [Porospora cf. gigantea B]
MMAFTGLATKSLIIESKGFGDSILAILGAGLLERSGSQKTKGADRDMRIRISKLFCGDDSCQTSTLGMETATGDMDEKIARTEQHMLTLRAAYEKRMAMQLEHHRRPVNVGNEQTPHSFDTLCRRNCCHSTTPTLACY